MNFVARPCLRILRCDITNISHVCGLGRPLSYKSAHALDNLYPKSNLKLYTPNFVPQDPNAKFNGFIPIDQLQIMYSCSSGPGGQNVNNVKTKVDLRFNVNEATWLDEEIKSNLLAKYSTKISKDGCLVIKSDITRSQHLNLADAMEKLRTMIRQSIKTTAEVSPETEEKLMKRQLKAARDRLVVKRQRSTTKQQRQSPTDI